MDNCEDVEIEIAESNEEEPNREEEKRGNVREIITSKCTGINIIKGECEWPIPCQFISKFDEKQGKIITEPIELDK